MANSFLAKQRQTNEAFFTAGLQTGRQQVLDMMCLALREPDAVGKDIFGGRRLMKIVRKSGELLDKYAKAWQKDPEADYYRAKLDEALADAFGPDLHDSFLKRYEYAAEFDYQKGKWKK